MLVFCETIWLKAQGSGHEYQASLSRVLLQTDILVTVNIEMRIIRWNVPLCINLLNIAEKSVCIVVMKDEKSCE